MDCFGSWACCGHALFPFGTGMIHDLGNQGARGLAPFRVKDPERFISWNLSGLVT
jgi:hypothetical protein